MFVCAAAETLPGLLEGVADEIAINYPWGSLLRAVALPDVSVLAGVAMLAKAGAKVTALINAQPLRDAAQAGRLGLAEAALLRGEAELRGGFARAGLDLMKVREVTDDALPVTSWGKHLAVSKREIWKLEARVVRR